MVQGSDAVTVRHLDVCDSAFDQYPTGFRQSASGIRLLEMLKNAV